MEGPYTSVYIPFNYFSLLIERLIYNKQETAGGRIFLEIDCSRLLYNKQETAEGKFFINWLFKTIITNRSTAGGEIVF